MWDNPQFLGSVVTGSATIIATVVAAVTAALIGKKFSDQKKLKGKLDLACDDIEFLLKVEAQHCEMHKDDGGDSNKNRVRESVSKELGRKFSGKFTPGRAKDQ